MATKKKTGASSGPKKKTKKKAPASSGKHITIRMYNVGFGDAFLVLIPGKNGPRRILFDCGSIEAAKNTPMDDIVDRIVKDVTDPDGIPRIDVVVATHRHKDHVSGFAKEDWANVEVKEVWMPWTEHPTDSEARRIRNIQSKLAVALSLSLSARAMAAKGEEKEDVNRATDIVANALMLSNAAPMRTLHNGFAGGPERYFLPERGKAAETRSRTFVTDALPGVKVHVMGPSRERDVIRDMDPPAGHSYLRMGNIGPGPRDALTAPFAPEFRKPQRDYGQPLSDEDLAEIHKAGQLSDLAVATALDKAVNGTSLMLMLEVSGTFLLFPGDAQWGTWMSAMSDPEWSDLMQRVTFYKIGHHGSHNATPVEFVEEMIPAQVSAMASTLTRKIWPDIPRMPLLDRLVEKKAHIARSDRAADAEKPFRVDKGVIETEIPL